MVSAVSLSFLPECFGELLECWCVANNVDVNTEMFCVVLDVARTLGLNPPSQVVFSRRPLGGEGSRLQSPGRGALGEPGSKKEFGLSCLAGAFDP